MNEQPATNVAAVAAVTSSWWLPLLKDASAFSADVLPILGAIWLVVQIVNKVLEPRK